MKDFINQNGFVTATKGAPAYPGEGNGWLQTGLAFACGMYTTERVPEMIKTCRVSAFCPILWRSQYKKNPGDENKIDDQWGAAILSPEWAREILDYARRNNWNFDPLGLGRLEYRFDRFIHFPPFLALCAGEKISLWEKVIFSSLIAFASIDAADGNMKTFCRIHVAKKFWIGSLAAKIWEYRARRKYGTLGKSWAEYFCEGHPLAEFV